MPHQAASYSSVNQRQEGQNKTMQMPVFPRRLRLRSKVLSFSIAGVLSDYGNIIRRS